MAKKQQKKEQAISTSFKIFLTAWAFVENGIFSGLRAGWSALVYILKQERVYADLCFTNITGNSCNSSNQTTNIISCDEQDAIFNECFTIASATMALSALLYGHLNYKYGIRAPRILSVIIFVGGACCFAFIDKDTPWLVFPGLLLISSGGMALYITNNQLSYMYTSGSAAVVGLLCGALEASSIVQTIIKILYENGISLFISYITLAGLYCLTLISTIFFLPKDFIDTKKLIETSDELTIESGQDAQSDTLNRNDAAKRGLSDARKKSDVEIRNVLDASNNNFDSDTEKMLSAALHNNLASNETEDEEYKQVTTEDGDIAWDPVGNQRSVYKVDDVGKLGRSWSHTKPEVAPDESEEILPKDSTDSKTARGPADRFNAEKTLMECLLTKTFMLYLFWAVTVQIILSMTLGTFNPWLEYVTNKDRIKVTFYYILTVSEFTDVLFYSMLGNTSSEDIRTLHTATVSLGVTSLLGVLLCGLFMTCANDAIVVTSIALVIFRTGLYSCGTAFLRIMYPTQFFGILCGIMSVLSGGLSFLQYPLFLWIQYRNQAWVEVFGFLGITGLISLVQPAYLFWKSRAFKRASNLAKNNSTASTSLKADFPGIQDAQ
ncbi:unnamed protein product [Candidula unifasciata]|uniref:Solute carrier family 43 member 3 n=1 Tax=Candidula unifasciata TaxID=100452 RepID=A0A8S3YJE7_9EUPU|nr:unnamed protein product [Candidula unifasciata]